MPVLPFLDTNVLIYANSSDPKREVARKLLAAPFEISVQILNEFANAMRRKRLADWDDIADAVTDILMVAEAVHPVSLEAHLSGLKLAERYQLQVYDSVMLASALLAGCTTLYSEDMQDGMVIEGRLTIRNPFR
jgi:predicted nucleic acid-binding protein